MAGTEGMGQAQARCSLQRLPHQPQPTLPARPPRPCPPAVPTPSSERSSLIMRLGAGAPTEMTEAWPGPAWRSCGGDRAAGQGGGRMRAGSQRSHQITAQHGRAASPAPQTLLFGERWLAAVWEQQHCKQCVPGQRTCSTTRPSSPALYSQPGRSGAKATARTAAPPCCPAHSSRTRRVGTSHTVTPPAALPAARAASLPPEDTERHRRAEESAEGISGTALAAPPPSALWGSV